MIFFFFQAEDGIRDGTVTGVQTCALPISRMLQRGDEAAEGEIPEAVRVDEVRDFRDRFLVRDELTPGFHVDPKVAREPKRWAPDPHVDLASPRESQDLDDLPNRRPADDRIV